jgi:dipeptidyl aminopeptidase/acylaminoacyl peptidase
VRLRHWRWVLAGLLLLAVGTMGVLIGRGLAPNTRPMPRFTLKTFDEQAIFNARFMPDGQTIVYSAARSGNAPALFEIRSGTLEAQPFGPPRTHVLSVSSKGELAVLTDAHYIHHKLFTGTLARLSLEGEPRPWMDHVREADWSPDGSTLATAHDTGVLDRLEYPIGTVLYETAGYLSDLRVSPDGTRVAFMDHPARYDDSGWVKVVDAAGKVATLAGEFWGEEGLAWSPDGISLLFGAAHLRQGAGIATAGEFSYQVHTVSLAHPGRWSPALTSPGDFLIHDVAADGRWLVTREDARYGVVARGSGQPAERDLSWLNQCWGGTLSADGQRFVFTDGLAGPNYGVVWRTTDGSRITRLGEGNSFGFSPDGKWALALINTPSHLVLYPMGTGDAIHLNRGPLERIQMAGWFPDSRSVLVVGNEPSRPTRAYRQDIAGGVPRPLLPEGVIPKHTGGPAVCLAVAPDGQHIAATDTNGAWNLYPIDGGRPRPVAGLNPSDTVLGWRADGRSLYVFRVGDVPARIDIVDLATGRRAPFKELGFADRAGLLYVVPTWLADEGQQYAYSYRKQLSTLFLVSGAK